MPKERILNIIDDEYLFQIAHQEKEAIEKRENEILENIYNFSNDRVYNEALLFVREQKQTCRMNCSGVVASCRTIRSLTTYQPPKSIRLTSVARRRQRPIPYLDQFVPRPNDVNCVAEAVVDSLPAGNGRPHVMPPEMKST